MKKTLIALAAVAATSAAFAQSSVELYGRAEVTGVLGGKTSTDTSWSRVNTNPVTTTTTAGNGNIGGFTAKQLSSYERAVEILGANATPAQLAQAAKDSGFNPAAMPTSKPAFRIDDGNRNGDGSSRIGFRGTEDLGGGLKAVFQFEAGVNVDDGSDGNGGGNLFSRTAMVGLQGGFGRVTFGRQVTPAFGVFSASSAMGTMSGVSDPVASLGLHTVRESNSAMYRSNNFGGFSFSGMIAAPEKTTTFSDFDRTTTASTVGNVVSSLKTDLERRDVKETPTINAAVNYANGPLAVGFGFENRKTSTSDSFTGTVLNSTAVVGSSSGSDKAAVWTLGGSYDLGMAKLFASYSNGKYDMASASSIPEGTSNTLRSSAGSYKRNLMTFGVTAPVSSGLLFAEFGSGKTSGWSDTATVAGVTTNGLEGTTQSDKSQGFSIGYRYPMSKRTFVQAAYGQSKRTVESTFTFKQPAGVTNFSDVTRVNTVMKNSGLGLTLSHSF